MLNSPAARRAVLLLLLRGEVCRRKEEGGWKAEARAREPTWRGREGGREGEREGGREGVGSYGGEGIGQCSLSLGVWEGKENIQATETETYHCEGQLLHHGRNADL